MGGERNTWPVIENYRSSALTSHGSNAAVVYGIKGCSSPTLNRQSVLVDIFPDYYPADTIPVITIPFPGQAARHTVGISMYLHCMKWIDDERAVKEPKDPSCRTPTSYLKKLCSVDDNGNCLYWFKQTAGMATTWDFDDRYVMYKWSIKEPEYRDRAS